MLRSGAGLVCKRLPFLVNHCTCRSSAFITRGMYFPARVCGGSDLRAAKTICQSGTPAHTLLPRGQGSSTPALAYP